MAIFSAADIDVIKQGLYKVPTKVTAEANSYKFLQNVLFGGPSEGSELDFLAMDYRSRGIGLSEEAIKGADPNRVNYGSGFNEKAIFGLYYNDEDEVSCDQADNRVWGEPMDQRWSPVERMTYLLADKRDRIILAHEQMMEIACASALINGYFTSRRGNQTFPMSSALLNVSGANMTTNPIGVLTAGIKQVLKTKGARPRRLVMNADTAVTVLGSTKMQAILDNRRTLGNEQLYTELDANGAGFGGTLNLPGVGTVDVVIYMGGYTDANGNYQYYIPANTAILCPERVGHKGFCGVYEDNGLFTGKAGVEHGVHIWAEQKALPYTTHVQVQSAPCPMLTAIDQYCVFTSIS
jgi:hypothetical protein